MLLPGLAQPNPADELRGTLGPLLIFLRNAMGETVFAFPC